MSMGTRSARAGEVRPGAQAQWVLSSPAPSPSLSESPGESRPEAASQEPLVRSRGVKELLQRVVHRAGHKRAQIPRGGYKTRT